MKSLCGARDLGERREESVSLVARVEEVRAARTRDGRPYLDVALADPTGHVRAFVWENSPAFAAGERLRPGDLVLAGGRVRQGGGGLAFHLQELGLVSAAPPPPAPAPAGEAAEAVAPFLGRTVVFDIETVPAGLLAELPEGVGAAVRRAAARDDDDPVKVMSLSPLLGRLVCLGLMDAGDPQRAVALLLAPPGQAASLDRVRLLAGEEGLLQAFWHVAAGAERLISFNGRRFDVPFLQIRSAVLGVAVSRDLFGSRWSTSPHLDLWDLATCRGALRGPASLETCCHAFGVESPKGSMDGSQVAPAYLAGRIEEIAAYNLADLRATAELYRRLAPLLQAPARGDEGS